MLDRIEGYCNSPYFNTGTALQMKHYQQKQLKTYLLNNIQTTVHINTIINSIPFTNTALRISSVSRGLLIFLLFFAATAFAGGEPYSSRPDILNSTIEARPCAWNQIQLSSEQIAEVKKRCHYDEQTGTWYDEHSKLSIVLDESSSSVQIDQLKCWGNRSRQQVDLFKIGFMETIAEILELYPEHHIYFLGRDGEVLYDFARALTENTPDQFRLHLLLASRTILYHPEYKRYLEQNGIDEHSLEQGKKILFVDVGYRGSASQLIASLFPAKYGTYFHSHFLLSKNERIPSTRVFQMITSLYTDGELVCNLEGLPLYFNCGNEIILENSKWEAQCPIEKKDYSDPIFVDKMLAIERMGDIKLFARQTARKFELRRSQIKSLRELFLTGEFSEFKANWEKLETSDGIGKALSEDICESLGLLTQGK